MSIDKNTMLYGGLLVAGVFLPLALPAFQTQIAIMWMLVTFALTWDILGGRMGYNSFGNIVFFGVGMYAAVMTQHELYFDIGQFEVISDKINLQLTPVKYILGLGLGVVVGAVVCVLLAWLLGSGVLRLRGHYFAICTLGLGVAVGEIAGGIDYIGAGSGISAPLFPLAMGPAGLFYAYYFFVLSAVTFMCLRWLYSNRFGLVINAIRDDEDKAEAFRSFFPLACGDEVCRDNRVVRRTVRLRDEPWRWKTEASLVPTKSFRPSAREAWARSTPQSRTEADSLGSATLRHFRILGSGAVVDFRTEATRRRLRRTAESQAA